MMRFAAILNRDGGTLKTTDLDAYIVYLKAQFAAAGRSVEASVVAGSEIIAALQAAAEDDRNDGILAGGGDGTVSAAAGVAWRAKKPLGVIPAGTMNLFARSIGVPLDIREAAATLANASVTQCDIACANDRPFVHQISIGLQSHIVRKRNRLDYHSRLSKMLASLNAVVATLSHPPAFRVAMTLDGTPQAATTLSLIAVTNNTFGKGHVPYADDLTGGVLGVYSVGVLSYGAAARLMADLVLGRWDGNPDFAARTAHQVTLDFPKFRPRSRAVIDGELIPLTRQVTVRIHPGALAILAP